VKRWRWFPAVAALAAALASPLAAQDTPKRPLRFMIGFAPGGSADLVSRLLGQRLAERLGQPVIAEQKMGASGLLANDVVAKAPPDGQTLVLLTGGHPVAAVMMKERPYDPVRDFAMVSVVTGYPMVISVVPDSPVKSFADLIARAKTDRITYATSGPGSLHDLVGELINVEAGIGMVGVPFKGAALGIVDLLGGRVDVMVETATFSFPQIRAGKLRALAQSYPGRYPLMPEVPAIAETLPGVEASSWLGLATSPGTPRPIVERLNREVRAIVELPEMRQRLAELGGVPSPSTPEEMRERIEREIARWRRVVELKKIERQ
jgi:tripartite-type tricarboxylate transporter receptor subunit TctC